MWQKAESGVGARKIALSSDVDVEEAGNDRLAQLHAQAEGRRSHKAKTIKKGTASTTTKGGGVKVRKLKKIDMLDPSQGAIVNAGAPQGGVIIPAPRDRTTTGGEIGRKTGDSGSSAAASVLPPVSEREELAYDAVVAALALGEGEVADLRRRRGVGADALDVLRQCFEIKMSSGSEIPNEITLTPNEIERARSDPDFFLAVVAGLEEGAGELRVRFIFDPLARLPLRLRSDLTFGGVRDAEALEYVFPTSTVKPKPAEAERQKSDHGRR